MGYIFLFLLLTSLFGRITGVNYPPSLVSYWNFDESSSGTGDAYDPISANHGTFIGSSSRTCGLIGLGAARFFQRNGDGIKINGFKGFEVNQGITIELLFVTDAAVKKVRYSEFFRKEDGNYRILLSLQEYGSLLSFGLNRNGVYSESEWHLSSREQETLFNNKVHHLVATFGSGVVRFYVDGINSFQEYSNPVINSGGDVNACIGCTYFSNYYSDEPFYGTIDEVAFYNDPLSPYDVRIHYQLIQKKKKLLF